MRHLTAGTFSLLTLTMSSACGSATGDNKHAALVQQIPSAKSIIQCSLNAVVEPLAHNDNALKRASQAYQAIDSTGNAVTALESVHKKALSDFTYDEQAESLFILSGLESCDGFSAAAKKISPEAIILMLSGRPASGLRTLASPRQVVSTLTTNAGKQSGITQSSGNKKTSNATPTATGNATLPRTGNPILPRASNASPTSTPNPTRNASPTSTPNPTRNATPTPPLQPPRGVTTQSHPAARRLATPTAAVRRSS